jgi:hypothetical protein
MIGIPRALMGKGRTRTFCSGLKRQTNQLLSATTKMRARNNKLILFVNLILLNCMLTCFVLCKKDRYKIQPIFHTHVTLEKTHDKNTEAKRR